jgi:guanine nucleotide-binding protein G(I)/G(S)/G(T) subunit beta-1
MDVSGEIEDLRARVKDLKWQLVEGKDADLTSVGKGRDHELVRLGLKARRRLEGHFGKIYAFAWGPDSTNVVSASQDGNMFVWNALYGLKMQGITLRSSWVMSCGYSPEGRFVSTAGLDNVVWIYEVKEGATEDVHCELSGHEGYISSCTFIAEDRMLTTSGDCSAALWDIENRRVLREYTEHNLDVNCCAVSPDKNIFVTGSCDSTTKVWDIRENRSIRTFVGHESDVNAVAFFPDGNAFVSGSDDATCRLFDIRAYGQLNKYFEDQHFCGVTSAAISKSGKYLFASYDTGPVYVWDTVKAETVQTLEGHEKRVSRVRVSPDGLAVCTASWDTSLIVWA